MQANMKEFHEKRRNGIGGSDCAPALGLSKWKTPYSLYQEKRGEIEPQDETWEMGRGKALEPLLRQNYADTTGRKVIALHEAMRSDRHHFMTYSPDGLIVEEKRLVEFKTAAYGKEWGEVGSDEIPQEYLLQVQHGLIVTGYDVCDVTVSIAGNKPKYFVVEADRELQEMIIDREAVFWDMVQAGTPPDPISNDDVAKIYRRVNGQSIVANADICSLLGDLRLVRDNIKNLEGEKESLEVTIKSFIGENEVLVAADGFTPLATWKQQNGAKRIDADLLRSAYPQAAAECTKQGDPIRRFLLK